MIIDFHTHTFPDKIAEAAIDKLSHAAHMKAYRDGTEGSLKKSMKEAGIDFSVVLPVATYPEQAVRINEGIISKFSGGAVDGLISLGAMHPLTSEWEEELERLAENGIVGIKVHPLYQDTDFNDDNFIKIFKKCAELDLLVVTHSGLDIGVPENENCTPQMVADTIEKVNRGSKELKLVLAHMGGWFNWEESPVVLKGMPFFVDTAFSFGDIEPIPEEEDVFIEEYRHMMTESEMTDLIHEYGVERVLFGTDSPWMSQSYGLEWIKRCRLTDEEFDLILEKNARKLLDRII